MSVPVTVDRALIKLGDGATPTEVFATICGIETVQINETANTNDSAKRDCTKPFEVPSRTVSVRSKQLDISGSGMFDENMLATAQAVVGKTRNYRIELLKDNGTDAGVLVGHYSGPFVMTSRNFGTGPESDGTAEISLVSDGAYTYNDAP